MAEKKLRKFRIYADAIGRPDYAAYTPRKDYDLVVEARTEAAALTAVAEKLGVPRARPMARYLPVLGVGSLKAELVKEDDDD